MAQTSYCNTTTDLARAYSKIHEGFREQRVVKGMKPHSATVWKLGGLGFVEALQEDGLVMTAVASVALIDAAMKYFYDSTTDILYFYPTGGVPDVHVYKIGEPWATVLTDCVEIASRDAESLLDKITPVPVPMSPDGTQARPWDRDFVDAVARMAAGHIASRSEPMQFDNQGNPAEGNIAAQLYSSGKSVIMEYADGKRIFSWALTEDELGRVTLRPSSTNTSGGVVQIRGTFDPNTSNMLRSIFPDITLQSDAMNEPFWTLKISTAGIVGTAKFKVQIASVWADETVTSNAWTHIANNIWVRFLGFTDATTFTQNDTWQMEVHSPINALTNPTITSKGFEVA